MATIRSPYSAAFSCTTPAMTSSRFARRAISMAYSTPFSGTIRPRNRRYPADRSLKGELGTSMQGGMVGRHPRHGRACGGLHPLQAGVVVHDLELGGAGEARLDVAFLLDLRRGRGRAGAPPPGPPPARRGRGGAAG